MARVSGMWVGPRLTALERACITSFLARGHEFDLYVYDDIGGLPSGCRVLDAASILPGSRIFAHASGAGRGSVAGFADMFRYRLLKEHGGWWVDLDVFCLTEALPAADVVIGRQNSSLINVAVMHFPPQHPVLIEACELTASSNAEVDWAQIGPVLMTKLVETHGLQSEVLPASVFYPIAWQHYWAVLDPRRSADVLNRLEGAACLHLWNEMLRRLALDKDVLPPAGSVLRALYESTIGVTGFTQEYALAAGCADNEFRLDVREISPAAEDAAGLSRVHRQ